MDISKIYILFMRGRGLLSRFILATEKLWDIKNEYTHVGLVFHKNKLKKDNLLKRFCLEEDFYILESTLSGDLNDTIKSSCNQIIFGIQFRSFNKFMNFYKDKKIKANLIELKYELELDIDKYIYKKYDYNLLNLSTMHIPYIYFTNNKYFCSDLIISILQDNGLIGKEINRKNVSPNVLLKIIKKYNLDGDEIKLF